MDLKGSLIVSLGSQAAAASGDINGCAYLEGGWEPISLVMQ